MISAETLESLVCQPIDARSGIEISIVALAYAYSERQGCERVSISRYRSFWIVKIMERRAGCRPRAGATEKVGGQADVVQTIAVIQCIDACVPPHDLQKTHRENGFEYLNRYLGHSLDYVGLRMDRGARRSAAFYVVSSSSLASFFVQRVKSRLRPISFRILFALECVRFHTQLGYPNLTGCRTSWRACRRRPRRLPFERRRSGSARARRLPRASGRRPPQVVPSWLRPPAVAARPAAPGYGPAFRRFDVARSPAFAERPRLAALDAGQKEQVPPYPNHSDSDYDPGGNLKGKLHGRSVPFVVLERAVCTFKNRPQAGEFTSAFRSQKWCLLYIMRTDDRSVHDRCR